LYVATFRTWANAFIQDAPLPSAARDSINFDKHIRPILAASCVKCHARGQRKGGFSIETRESLLAGGDGGPAVVVGKSSESLLIELVAGLEADRLMPQKGDRLSPKQVGLLRAWIDQGLAWPDGFSFGFPRAALEPRRPAVPPVDPISGSDHPIDRLLQPYFREHGMDAHERAGDRVFARRAFLDLAGLLPTPDELDSFERDKRPEKRALLVRRLLDDRRAFTDHWLTFWNDALRNAYHGTGYIDGGRQQITAWLYQSLYDNKPYDQFVRELVSPVPGSEGFTKGIVWRGVVNASQVPPMQAAQNISQVFLGTNLKCASCHDSFVNYWKLKDAYALASVFSDGPLEMHRCDKPTGDLAEPAFIFPQLGAMDAAADRTGRQRQLAELLTSPQNGRFARTIVNRLWAWFFGRGLVEPVDDMDQHPWHADLLDWLAADLVEHGFDLKHAMATICTSRAYELVSVGVPSPDDASPWVFRGPLVKRLTAEQFVDAVDVLTGFKRPTTPQMIVSDGRAQGGQLNVATAIVDQALQQPDVAQTLRRDARWVWSHAEAHRSDPGGRIFARKQIVLSHKPSRVVATLSCDNEFVLLVNGKNVASGKDWTKPASLDLTAHFTAGANTIAIEAINWPDAETGKGLEHRNESAAGFIFFAAGFHENNPTSGPTRNDVPDHAEVRNHAFYAVPAWTVASDETWLWSKDHIDGWDQPEFDTADWQHVSELGPASADAWKLAEPLVVALRRQVPTNEVRSVLFNEDPLSRALGRPNREQVVTRRDSIATTLQALELTNGRTLDEMLKAGAAHWLDRSMTGPELTRRLFERSLGRPPSVAETEAAGLILGDPISREGVEDLLWAIVMLPEFQMIH
jgi:hypothetical protein